MNRKIPQILHGHLWRNQGSQTEHQSPRRIQKIPTQIVRMVTCRRQISYRNIVSICRLPLIYHVLDENQRRQIFQICRYDNPDYRSHKNLANSDRFRRQPIQKMWKVYQR